MAVAMVKIWKQVVTLHSMVAEVAVVLAILIAIMLAAPVIKVLYIY